MSHISGSTCQSAASASQVLDSFLSAPYVQDEGGRRRPAGQLQCLWGDSCRVKRNGYRKRKTGPGFPIQILYCHHHGHSFPVYPIGHVPFARVAVTPMQGEASANGDPLTPTGPRCSSRGSLQRCGPRCRGRPAVDS